MIRNQWYAVLDAAELKAGKLLGVTRLGERLVFWRDSSGKPHCIYDRCAHRGAALSGGVLHHDHVLCPFHALPFDGKGRVTSIPANGKDAPVPANFQVHHYPAFEAQGFVWIWWGDPEKATEEPRLLPEYQGDFLETTIRDHWPVHYSRSIENQLDVVHIPYVHRRTIGRRMGTLVDGPHVEETLGQIQVWVQNRKDDGTPPKKPAEVPMNRPCNLHFCFPNVWHNRISEDFRVVAAFAPIDEENTLVYVRFCQKWCKIPLLGRLVALVGGWASRIILSEDKQVVVTQIPKASGLKIGENLFQGDGPIMAYRKQRETLLRQEATSSKAPQ